MNLKRIAVNCTTFLILAFQLTFSVAENRVIPFQGRLTDGNSEPITGVENIIFSIYEKPTVGTPLWTERHEKVSVIDGQVNVLLGVDISIDEPTEGGAPIDFTKARYLGITVGDGGQEMLPRHQLIPSFHARNADLLDSKPASFYNVPLGTIVAWYKGFNGKELVLPEGWVELDGSVLNDDKSIYHLATLPDLNGGRRFLRGGDNAGELEDDALQNHKHIFNGQQGTTGGANHGAFLHSTHQGNAGVHDWSGGAGELYNKYNHNHTFTPSGTITDPSTGRSADETRPINMSVVWIMRIK